MRRSKLLKFVGQHDELITGRYYTVREYSEVVGVNDKTMHSRLKNKKVVDDHAVMLYPPLKKVSSLPLIREKAEKLSALWLSKSLI